jgi:hypothetical protein
MSTETPSEGLAPLQKRLQRLPALSSSESMVRRYHLWVRKQSLTKHWVCLNLVFLLQHCEINGCYSNLRMQDSSFLSL